MRKQTIFGNYSLCIWKHPYSNSFSRNRLLRCSHDDFAKNNLESVRFSLINLQRPRVVTIFVFISSLLIMLAAASSFAAADKSVNNYKTILIQAKPFNTTLYFHGIVKPMNITSVVAPVDGVVVKMSFQYGQKVKKGQPLIELSSNKLQEDYQSALTNYLKAKEDYNTTVSKYKAEQALWKLQIIPQDELVSAKSSLDSSHISYLQATYALEAQLKKSPNISASVKELRLSEFNRVDKALQVHYNNLEINADGSGVALPPSKSGTDSQAETITVGSSVKLGQMITKIGDLDGVSLEINVDEVDINQIKLKQKVVITGVGFPGITLNGYIDSIDAQASESGGSGGLPTFPVKLIVPKLTDNERKVIRVGMTAKVELQIGQPEKIVVPLGAVYRKNGDAFVNVLVNGQAQPRAVTTGQTTVSSVEILSGLTNGDKVISDATSSH